MEEHLIESIELQNYFKYEINCKIYWNSIEDTFYYYIIDEKKACMIHANYSFQEISDALNNAEQWFERYKNKQYKGN